MSFGFMANESVVTGITTAYDVTKPIKLVGYSLVDIKSRPMPQACHFSQFDAKMVVVSGAPRCVQVLFTWDEEGTDPALREAEYEWGYDHLTGAGINAIFPIHTIVRAPSTQTEPQVMYAWVKVDDGVVNLSAARLHWATRGS